MSDAPRRVRGRRAAVPLALLLACSLAIFLSACGGGGGSTSSTATTAASTAAQSAASNAKPAPSQASGQSSSPSHKTTQRSAPTVKAAAERRAAGAAAPFVKPQADNSIPTFGAEAPSSERDRAEAALRAYLTARAKGDWAAACIGLAASTREGIERFAEASKGKLKNCAPLYKALSANTPPPARANPLAGRILALRIKGSSGFALFYGPKGEGEKYVMPMAREGGVWKVTQLAPIAYPLGSQTSSSP